MGLILALACVSEPPPPHSDPPDSPVHSDPPELPGRALYYAECLGCHGTQGNGSDQAPAVHEALAGWTDSALIDVMVDGQGDMEPRDISREDGQHIVDWMRATF